MKVTKYLAIAIGAVVVLLVTGWFLRNALIERLSNPMLDEYDLRVTDVSLDALAARDARISRLELEHDNGAKISIDGLTLPVRRSASGLRSIRAAQLRIQLPAGGDDEILDLAGVLVQLLELPLQLLKTEVVIGELSAPPYPVIRNLHWRFMDNRQKLTAKLDTLSLEADITQASDTYYLVNLSFSGPGTGSKQQSVTADVRRIDAGIALEGSGSFDLRSWSPVIALLGIDTIDVESGFATLRFDGEIAYDTNQIPFVNAGFTPTAPVKLGVAKLTDAVRSITLESASTTEISIALTDLQWTLRQPQAALTVSDGNGNEVNVSLGNLSCRSGPACSGDVRVIADELDFPFVDIARLELAATQEIAMDETGVQARLQPDATFALSGVDGPDLAFARLGATLTSAAEFDLGVSGWEFTSQSVDIAIEKFSIGDGLTYSVTAFLDDVAAGEENQQQFLSAGLFAPASHANWNGSRLGLPGFKGSISRQDTVLAVDLETNGLAQEADIEARHDLGGGAGQLSLKHAGLSFAPQPLSKRIAPHRRDWDVMAGTFDTDLEANWRKETLEWTIAAETSIRATDLAGHWQDTVFAGLTTGLEAEFDSAAGFTVEPSTIELTLLDVGVPLQNISAKYTLHPDAQSVDVENLRMNAFGGIITADPFSFSTANERNNLLLRAESIDLARVLSIEAFEAIEISGRIGAELPVTIEGESVTVSGGKLRGESPGGVIRYRPGTSAGQPDTSSIGFAARALSNFQYDTLSSSVDYDPNGDLKLQMRLTGRNPDLESNRPVVLNLGIENNVPQMLRSLQAARAVEEILERRLGQ